MLRARRFRDLRKVASRTGPGPEGPAGPPRPRRLSHGRPGLPRNTARRGPGTWWCRAHVMSVATVVAGLLTRRAGIGGRAWSLEFVRPRHTRRHCLITPRR